MSGQAITYLRALSLSLFKFQLIFSFYSSLINESHLFIHIYSYWRNVYKRKSGIRPKKRKSPKGPFGWIRRPLRLEPTMSLSGPQLKGSLHCSFSWFSFEIVVLSLHGIHRIGSRQRIFLCYEELDTAQAQITRAPNLSVWMHFGIRRDKKYFKE